MKTHKEVLDILKAGIHEFIEIAVKQQHDRLLASLPDIRDSGFTRLEQCYECNRDNLKPRHSENACPSLNYCFCKNKRREKRACPNRTCDYIYEGIIEDHVKYSPNLKTTDISQWTQNYWDIAKCYMKHSSQSAESTDTLDLLHLISNNRFVLQKLLPNEKEESTKTPKERLSEVRSILNKIAQDIGIGRKESLSTQELELKIRDAVEQHFKSGENALSCKQTDATGNALKSSSLQVIFRQKLLVAETIQSFEEGQFVKRSIADLLYRSEKYQTIFVSTETEDPRSTHWSEKEWFIHNVLKDHFKQETETSVYAKLKEEYQYSNVIVVSKTVLNRIDVSYKTVYECILNDILPSRKNCLVILDFCDEAVKGVFKKLANKDFERHTIVKLFHSRDAHNLKSKRQLRTAYVKAEPVHNVSIRNVGGDVKLGKETAGVIQQIIYKAVKKIGDINISSLSFEKICFDDASTKIKLSNISELNILRLIGCAFTPVNLKCVKSVEILSDDSSISHFLDQVKLMLHPAIQTCFGFQNITSEIKIGDKSFCMKLNTKKIAIDAEKYFGVTLLSCSRENVLELLDIETSKILMSAGCDIGDFKLAEEKEKAIILNSIRFGLLESDQNFVHVYPAQSCLSTRKSRDIVFVCFMKDNFDIDNECVFKKFRGFDTFQRSYNRVSPESFLAESAAFEFEGADRIITEQVKIDIEEAVAYNSTKLMEKHCNLEAVGVSLGKARKNTIELGDGPYIVLYVRLKSFVPYGEDKFPPRLAHPKKPSVMFKTDIREGYFMHLADNEQLLNHPLLKLPVLMMGCSIGFPDNDYAATVGPFVEIESGDNETNTRETGFLTVCHLFSTPENATSIIGTPVVQPSNGDELCVNLSTKILELGDPNDTVCGEVIACEYSEHVDVALVKITQRHPCKGSFITCQKRDLKDAGFGCTPEYNDGSVSSLQAAFRKNVVKIGKTSYLSLGMCSFKRQTVRIVEHDVSSKCPISRVTFSQKMTNLFQICGINKTFSEDGDSGAGVFIVNENNQLSCIGMIIGKLSDGHCLATPIQTILDRLSASPALENCNIRMKRFEH